MKYLNKYSLFREKIEKDITDSAALASAKDSVNKKEEWKKQYDKEKTTIDNLYNINQESLKEEDIKAKLDQIGVAGNTFLQQYVKVKELEYKVKNLKDKQSKEEVRMSKFKSDLPTLSRDLEKKNVQIEIDRLGKSIALSTQDLVQIEKEIKDSELEMKKKLDELQKENEEDIKKISEEDKK